MSSQEHMNNHHHHLNFILIPLMSPGHLIPMIDMAKRLAQQGVTVTIITTTHNAARFHSVIDRAAASGLSIKLLSVKFPSAQATGLPEGCESSDTLPSYDLMTNFFSAIGMLQEPMEKMIEEINPTPCCIICDKYMFWTLETAKRYKIPRILFDGMSCFSVLCSYNLYHITKVQDIVAADQDQIQNQLFIVPNIPDEIVLTKSQLPGAFNPGSLKVDDFRALVRISEKEAFGVVVNSFEELEPSYVDGFRKIIKGGRVWCIGPLSICSKELLDKAQRGSLSSSNHLKISEWLDLQEHGKVVYACLGSLTRLPPTQFVELALGLEEAEYPFILVIKAKGKAKEEIERWILENGFEERTKGRSLLIRDWAPQALILSHPAIGGFLTHCGWNSTIEAISEGVPMITWPMFGEQFFNEKQVVQILKNGVSVGAKSVRHLGGELGMAEGGVTVMKEDIRKAIVKVMKEDEEEDAKETRRRAKQLGGMSKMAMEIGGSSHVNISLLIQEIQRFHI